MQRVTLEHESFGRRIRKLGFVMFVTVYEFERALVYRHGRFNGILDAGRHVLPRIGTAVCVVDVRPQFLTVAGQEVLTADGVSLKVSLVAEYEIADLDLAFNRVAEPYSALYAALQVALREIVGAVTVDELLARRADLSTRILASASARAGEAGVRLRSTDVKDLMFPGELKRVFAKVAEARQEGLAALERARGETAALRSLANAAKVIDASPALAHLRTLQAAERPGTTIVLGLPR